MAKIDGGRIYQKVVKLNQGGGDACIKIIGATFGVVVFDWTTEVPGTYSALVFFT